MQFPLYKKGDYCWYLPSLHAVRIVDSTWGGNAYFFEPELKVKGNVVSRALPTELRRIRPGDPAYVLGYGESGIQWKPGTVVKIVQVFQQEGCQDFPLQVHGLGGITISVGLDEIMRFAPARKKYLEQQRIDFKQMPPIAQTAAKKGNKKLAQALTEAKKKAEKYDKVKEALKAPKKKKPVTQTQEPQSTPVLKSAKTIIEEAKEKSKYNPEVLAISELTHEYERLRGKYARLLKKLQEGADIKSVSEEIEKTEEEIREAQRKLELGGYRRFK